MDKLKQLVGSTISKVHTSKDNRLMYLTTDKGIFEMSTVEECCSETWFSDIYNFDALRGKVTATESVDLSDYDVNDGRTRQCEDEAYCLKVTTDKGSSQIVFRNSSNGYYCGSLGDIEIIRGLPSDLIEITDDWKA